VVHKLVSGSRSVVLPAVWQSPWL